MRNTDLLLARKLGAPVVDVTFSRESKRIAIAALDSLILLVCLWAAFALRLGHWWPAFMQMAWWLFPAVPLTAIPIFAWLGLYRDQQSARSGAELFNSLTIALCLHTLLLVWIAVVAVRLLGVPRSVFVIYLLTSFGLLLGSRLIWGHAFRAPSVKNDALPRQVVIYGADTAGAELVEILKASEEYLPIAFIDDKHKLHHRDIRGLRVYPSGELNRLIGQYGVREILLAIPSASAGRRTEVQAFLASFPVHVGVLPTPSWPNFAPDEIDAVKRVLQSGKVNYWTGQQCREFEQAFASCCEARYAVAVANGTVALELALHAVGVGPGDEVVVTPRTFFASASAVLMRGARPVFADVDPVSQNITADSIREVLSPGTKAIITVHLAGWPCDMDPILALAAERGLKVIEDCAQAHGATYKGRPVGSLGDAAAFSFCQDKIMTTGGEGGMLTTNDPEIWKRAWSLKDHGKSYDAVYDRVHPNGFRWLHESVGTNWRMTEMQAAIGLAQLRKLNGWVERRRRNAALLTQRLRGIPALRVTEPPDTVGHAYYKYYVFVRPEYLRKDWSRDRIMTAINAEGIACFTGSCPEVYLEKAFNAHGSRPVRRLPVAKALGETSLMFLVHPTLGAAEMEAICRVTENVLRSACSRELSTADSLELPVGLSA